MRQWDAYMQMQSMGCCHLLIPGSILAGTLENQEQGQAKLSDSGKSKGNFNDKQALFFHPADIFGL
jgi:hypothetical protein